jgi:hypothetical protein
MTRLGQVHLNQALMRIPRRAESVDRSALAATYVAAGSFSAMINSSDHQILYGRRGTGKTHALLHLSDLVERTGDISIYLDLRMIGSTGGLYVNNALSPAQRGTQLLVDALESIHDHLFTRALDGQIENGDAFLQGLDALVAAATEVEVVGETEQEDSSGDSVETDVGGELTLNPQGGARISSRRRASNTASSRQRRTGTEQHRVLFGPLSRAIQAIATAVRPARLWLLFDEWSSVPLDLQPFLADLFRRSVLPVQGITVKIAAIEHRARFSTPIENDYLGIEVGSDAAPAASLDDALIFGNSRARSEDFFGRLFYNHVNPVLAAMLKSDSPTSAEFLERAFQRGAFTELVRAAEGVPRDAINIAALSAQYANDRQVGISHVRTAARDWYLRDKQSRISMNGDASRTLSRLIDEVVGKRCSSTFALPVDAQNDAIGALYDARLLHVLRRGIVDHRKPGRLYDAFAIDYGCYVSLLLDGDDNFKRNDREWLTMARGKSPNGFNLAEAVVDLNRLTD